MLASFPRAELRGAQQLRHLVCVPKKELGRLKSEYQNLDHLQIRLICMCLFYTDIVELIQIISVLKLQTVLVRGVVVSVWVVTAGLSEALALLRGKDKELRHIRALTQILPMDTKWEGDKNPALKANLSLGFIAHQMTVLTGVVSNKNG
ncbi:hypothetical protein IHE44_0005451 [Lamprotornis superbus]|uniref:Uncharacterized protein n=1 Tax=Lamprotornis superbus TaxID=245042 RepID=A0A835NVM7_9PASS|nr:hypothetical protein IHE44_0005451 [Lamprotornis superbus]